MRNIKSTFFQNAHDLFYLSFQRYKECTCQTQEIFHEYFYSFHRTLLQAGRHSKRRLLTLSASIAKNLFPLFNWFARFDFLVKGTNHF